MRKEKALIALLRGLVDLIADESSKNPAFAATVEGLLCDVPERHAPPRKRPPMQSLEHLPDIHAEWNARGETDFRLWLADQPIPILRAVIRSQDLDPTRRTAKWKEAAKLAGFIADGLRARLSRGSAFIGRGPTE